MDQLVIGCQEQVERLLQEASAQDSEALYCTELHVVSAFLVVACPLSITKIKWAQSACTAGHTRGIRPFWSIFRL